MTPKYWLLAQNHEEPDPCFPLFWLLSQIEQQNTTWFLISFFQNCTSYPLCLGSASRGVYIYHRAARSLYLTSVRPSNTRLFQIYCVSLQLLSHCLKTSRRQPMFSLFFFSRGPWASARDMYIYRRRAARDLLCFSPHSQRTRLSPNSANIQSSPLF